MVLDPAVQNVDARGRVVDVGDGLVALLQHLRSER